jgi:hypothetical protein
MMITGEVFKCGPANATFDFQQQICAKNAYTKKGVLHSLLEGRMPRLVMRLPNPKRAKSK